MYIFYLIQETLTGYLLNLLILRVLYKIVLKKFCET